MCLVAAAEVGDRLRPHRPGAAEARDEDDRSALAGDLDAERGRLEVGGGGERLAVAVVVRTRVLRGGMTTGREDADEGQRARGPVHRGDDTAGIGG